jgi:hypothetical protein
MMTAGAGHEDPLLLEQAHGDAIVLAVGPRARGDRLARLDERRRVERDHAEAAALALEAAHRVERVHAQELHAIAQPVALDMTTRQRERGLRGVHGQHALGPAARHAHGPFALIAEDIECAAPRGAHLGAATVLALIEEQPSLLAVQDIDLEREAAHRDRDALGHRPPPHLAALVEALELAQRRVSDEYRTGGLEHLLECAAQRLHMRLHAPREHLHGEHVAIAVHDESRQLVGLAVDEPHRLLARVRDVAQSLGALESLHEERGVDLVTPAREQTRADEAVTIDVRPPEEGAARIEHLDEPAILDGPLPLLDLVREDPGMAAAHAPVLTTAQDETRVAGRDAHRAPARSSDITTERDGPSRGSAAGTSGRAATGMAVDSLEADAGAGATRCGSGWDSAGRRDDLTRGG